MTNKTYFANFFVPLCASLSDDAFLAFAEAALANLKKDSKADPADVELLEETVTRLRAAHTQQGPGGKAASTATLKTVVREFLQWAQLTNVQKVFPAFPDRKQAERIDIFPGGMDALYRADQTNILGRAKYYLDKISGTYGAKTGITPEVAAAQYQLLQDALTSRTTHSAEVRSGSAAVDAEELVVCGALYRAYAGLLHRFYEHPDRAYAYFPFPNTTGTPADGNLPSLPKGHPADGVGQ
jgi:hypothetical protein